MPWVFQGRWIFVGRFNPPLGLISWAVRHLSRSAEKNSWAEGGGIWTWRYTVGHGNTRKKWVVLKCSTCYALYFFKDACMANVFNSINRSWLSASYCHSSQTCWRKVSSAARECPGTCLCSSLPRYNKIVLWIILILWFYPVYSDCLVHLTCHVSYKAPYYHISCLIPLYTIVSCISHHSFHTTYHMTDHETISCQYWRYSISVDDIIKSYHCTLYYINIRLSVEEILHH